MTTNITNVVIKKKSQDPFARKHLASGHYMVVLNQIAGCRISHWIGNEAIGNHVPARPEDFTVVIMTTGGEVWDQAYPTIEEARDRITEIMDMVL